MHFSCFFVNLFVISHRDFESIRDITWKSAIRITVLSWQEAGVEGYGLPAGQRSPSSLLTFSVQAVHYCKLLMTDLYVCCLLRIYIYVRVRNICPWSRSNYPT